MSNDEKNVPLSVQRDAIRRAAALPTTNQPGVRFGMAERKVSENEERMRAHERAKYVDFFTRRDGKAPTEEMLPEHLREGEDGAA